MNIQSLHQADIYVTTRKNKLIQTKHGNDEFTTIDYEDRYEFRSDGCRYKCDIESALHTDI